jgi:O-antigen/teichoic acid export membrane protein
MARATQKREVGRLAIALVDQGAFAGLSFLASVVLARWMPPHQYGAYSYALASFLIAAGIHNSFVVEPLNVYGPARYRAHLSSYVTTTHHAHWLLCFALSAFAALAALLFRLVGHNSALAAALAGLSLSLGPILYFWLERRTHYMRGDVGPAAVGTAASGIGFLLGIVVLKGTGALTPLGAFCAMGLSSLMAGLLLSRTRPNGPDAAVPLSQVVGENLHYGRWLVAAMLLYWLTTSAYQIITANVLGLAEAGALRALQNLASPMTQVTTAMGLVFLPWLSTRHAEHGLAALLTGVWTFTLVNGVLALVYLAAMWLLSEQLFLLLYGSNYASFAWLAPYYCALPIIPALTTSWLIGLRAVDRTSEVLKVDVPGALLTVTGGAWLVRQWGLPGAVLGSFVSACGRLLVLPLVCQRAFREARSEPIVD